MSDADEEAGEEPGDSAGGEVETDGASGDSSADGAGDEAAGTGTARSGREEVWIEKYRPQRLDEIVGQEGITERLKSYVERNDLPHMLFAGQAGIGKCLTGETPVLTGEGVARIDAVVGGVDGFEPNEDGLSVLSLSRSGEFEYEEPSHVYRKPASELVEVRTRDGNDLQVTPEHKLLVVTGDGLEWRRAENLDAGDRLVRPLEAPLPETDPALDWVSSMAGERTMVHLDEAFARRYEIPPEEQFVGTKRDVVRGFREGSAVDEIATRAETSRKNVNRIRRETSDLDLSEPSSVCSLSYLRSLDLDRGELRGGVERIQNVDPSNNSRSSPIVPPWDVGPAIAEFLGLAISEARIDGSRIKFYNTDGSLLDRFESNARTLFDVAPRRGTQQGVPYVEIGNKTLTEYLAASFDSFDENRGTGIGSALLRADEASRRAFLRAVFDAEGHVTEAGILELTQKRDDVVTLLAYLLAGFGIPVRRKRHERRATNSDGPARTYHTLYISSAAHLSQFDREVGFTIEEKARRLQKNTDRTGNPNYDTVPKQRAVDELCRRLHLDKSSYVPETLDSETAGRETYRQAMDELLDEASGRLESVQERLERLTAIRPQLQALDRVPAQWAAARERLEPSETRREIAAETGIRSHRLLEYARGDRTPYAARTRDLLERTSEESRAKADLAEIQSTLEETFELLDVPSEHVADRCGLHGSDVRNLLEQEDHDVRSMTRFSTVADGLAAELAAMASIETIEAMDALAPIVDGDLYFDEVSAVEPVDEERYVYDLTVPRTGNFVAGDVPTVVHNTTAAQAVARELYGENWRDNFLELNASDERGIDVVRDRIKSFARTDFGGADYRIIFLDEADALTSDAQSALRRTMEQFSNNVRFILSCNYSSQIIDPIQSRCAVFRFAPLSDEAVAEELELIAEAEGIDLAEDGIEALVYAAGGDMRKAINGLQAAAVTGDVVDEDAVFEVTSTARPEDIREMVESALDGDFTAARSKLDHLLTEEGIAGGDVIDQLHRAVWEFDLEDEAAVRLLDRIGEADYRITEGASERIQLEALLASLALQGE